MHIAVIVSDGQKKHTAMSVSAVRESARSTAAEAIDIQKEEFRSLAIMADWDSPDGVYITMSTLDCRDLADWLRSRFRDATDASIPTNGPAGYVRYVRQWLTSGHITYRLRPTYYSPSSRTALAESELKYEDGHKSRSVYVGFDVAEADMSAGLKEAYDQAVSRIGQLPLQLAIWTTTAWTLPANAVSHTLLTHTYSSKDQ